MKRIPITVRKRPVRAHSNSDPPRPRSPVARVVLKLPIKRPPTEANDDYVSPYQDPAKVLEQKQFIEFGCGACRHHRLKADQSGYHCSAGVKLWPDATNKTCAAFMRRVKRYGSSKQQEGE